ncbi:MULTISPECIES: cob(I)yrinic acid a,c-diamide adenosyltransferase [Nitrosomonas]|uniref:Corrinoid adenosyltransferase n=2 Tax=Nitrosomonas eutropha TaxID=916 RepID=A0ABX5M4W3_9PROT|nr:MULTISPECIES: cob(I)yrinic acid a,c-diamide adenosyltransferase [Nitrosomonas]ABI60150.1 cob(I)yrinic acid a,c-diamide adenosyltransferase [Nitrosomonas eutropha C91]MXS80853.1 cob(I)yrinic acid a,c-diamide adenosyltransferase [Nitrosomonas sp. GH22]PXV77572.1 cob(I)yrinic acid a,c-diamide adenosyltransferase [Nitrosomonas eutropha]SCX15006.1 cob(I)yrinic acid a,c-diamide adenosyltransferase [Nitrosomonas eutropha]SDW67433.1 cob(I)yrinic acid a,c-diamide adenosyltransferase [Nitrosomonas eu
MNAEADRAQRHRARMQRQKTVVDAAIARADKSKGLLLVLTGNGKGKSSSAFGMAARALGHSMRVGVAQFIKGRSDTGEEAFFQQQKNIIWHVLGEGFTWDTQDLERDKETARRGWAVVQTMLHDPSIDLLILDELTYPLKFGWLDINTVLADLQNRPAMQHVVITGRAAPDALCQTADTVTEMRDIKHAFQSGIQAQIGIDY